jgi:hypothetical protein
MRRGHRAWLLCVGRKAKYVMEACDLRNGAWELGLLDKARILGTARGEPSEEIRFRTVRSRFSLLAAVFDHELQCYNRE